VDESAQEIPTLWAVGRVEWRRVAAVGREEVERAVWPVLVVMAAVDVEHVLEVTPPEDQDPVEAIGAEGAHPPFGVGVRVRRLDRRANHLDALGSEHGVEGVAELRVSIVDEKPERLVAPSCMTKLRACWVTQRPSGFEVEAMHSIRRVASEMKKST
jgi:hypothetical protein